MKLKCWHVGAETIFIIFMVPSVHHVLIIIDLLKISRNHKPLQVEQKTYPALSSSAGTVTLPRGTTTVRFPLPELYLGTWNVRSRSPKRLRHLMISGDPQTAHVTDTFFMSQPFGREKTRWHSGWFYRNTKSTSTARKQVFIEKQRQPRADSDSSGLPLADQGALPMSATDHKRPPHVLILNAEQETQTPRSGKVIIEIHRKNHRIIENHHRMLGNASTASIASTSMSDHSYQSPAFQLLGPKAASHWFWHRAGKMCIGKYWMMCERCDPRVFVCARVCWFFMFGSIDSDCANTLPQLSLLNMYIYKYIGGFGSCNTLKPMLSNQESHSLAIMRRNA